MCRIPHVCRRNGRYIFRCRIHFRKFISKPLAIALQTADPSLARERAALLSARFAVVRSSVNKMIETGRPMSKAEIEALTAPCCGRRGRPRTSSASSIHRSIPAAARQGSALKSGGPLPEVWHDAAYFAPQLWYYSHACREEICGLEVADVTADHAVSHFEIRDNFTRGRDGEKAGEKRAARRRMLPIHPELIGLGFLDYGKAIAGEGHVPLFPELYLFEAKRGGAQFYDRAWRFMVEWIGDRMPPPRNDKGKIPDIYSIRSLGSSF